MTKPIEPGCTCIVVNSTMGNNGKSLKVIKYIGDDENWWPGLRLWECDRSMVAGNSFSEIRSINNYFPEKNLLRIDDFDPGEDCKLHDILDKLGFNKIEKTIERIKELIK